MQYYCILWCFAFPQLRKRSFQEGNKDALYASTQPYPSRWSFRCVHANGVGLVSQLSRLTMVQTSLLACVLL